MQNRPKDLLYCGVRKDAIQNAKPVLNQEVLGFMSEFIEERYNIHLKKDVEKLPAPWTTNDVLSQVKFTNVRREHDRQSIEYINTIANADISWFDKFWNTVMFRMYNHINVFRYVFHDQPAVIQEFKFRDVQEFFRERLKTVEESGLPLFTNAFNTGGLKQSLALPEFDYDTCRAQRRGEMIIKAEDGSDINYKYDREKLLSGELKSPDFEPYMPMRIIRYIGKAANELFPDLHNEVFNAKTQLDAYNSLMKIRGFSRFLAYQVFVDLTYCKEFPFSENEFTVSGPGCDAGIDLLFEDKDGMTPDECVFWVRDNQHVLGIDFQSLMTDLPRSDRHYNVMSGENIFCELGKYVRCKRQISEGKKPRGKVGIERLESFKATQPESQQPSTKKLW